MKLADALSIADLQRLAQRRLPRAVYDYIEGGTEDERCIHENEAAFARIKIVPRYFTPCGQADQTVSLFGRTYASPFGIAPTGIAGLFHPNGDIALSEAAVEAGIPYVMSGWANAAIEDLSPKAAANAWYQIYSAKDRTLDTDLIGRARDAGIATLVITVDGEGRLKRERDIRNRFGAPRLATSAIIEALRHPAWLANYFAHGGRPTFAITSAMRGRRPVRSK